MQPVTRIIKNMPTPKKTTHKHTHQKTTHTHRRQNFPHKKKSSHSKKTCTRNQKLPMLKNDFSLRLRFHVVNNPLKTRILPSLWFKKKPYKHAKPRICSPLGLRLSEPELWDHVNSKETGWFIPGASVVNVTCFVDGTTQQAEMTSICITTSFKSGYSNAGDTVR